MKKYMITAATFLLIAGMADAQLAGKTPSKAVSQKSPMIAKTSAPAVHKTATVTTTSGIPATSGTTKVSGTTIIKRKHHYKKGNSLKKTTGK